MARPVASLHSDLVHDLKFCQGLQSVRKEPSHSIPERARNRQWFRIYPRFPSWAARAINTDRNGALQPCSFVIVSGINPAEDLVPEPIFAQFNFTEQDAMLERHWRHMLQTPEELSRSEARFDAKSKYIADPWQTRTTG